MPKEMDSHGRLYLPAEVRDKYGEKFHIVEHSDRLELIPVDEDDPLQAARDAMSESTTGD